MSVSGMLVTPPSSSVLNVGAFGPEIMSRSSILNDASELHVAMKPVLWSYRSSKCILKQDDGKILASMRTNTTGYRDLARALVVPSALILPTFVSGVLMFDGVQNAINNAIQKLKSAHEIELNENVRQLAMAYFKKLALIISVSTVVSFMFNFTLSVRRPFYEFFDCNNQVQVTARHQADRTSIIIGYTNRKMGDNIALHFLMKLNEGSNEWELYPLDAQGTKSLLAIRIPAEWHQNTRFQTVGSQNFTFNVTSMTRHSFRIGAARFTAPLTSGTEKFDMQFNGLSAVPRDILAFACYIARTIDTMPLDFLLYMVVLAAIGGSISVLGAVKYIDWKIRKDVDRLIKDTPPISKT